MLMENSVLPDGSESPPSSADRAVGMWGFGFDEESKGRLNAVYAALRAAMAPGEFEALVAKRKQHREDMEAQGATVLGGEVDVFPVTWVIDQAVSRKVCTPDEAQFLREEFVHENGLPLVI